MPDSSIPSIPKVSVIITCKHIDDRVKVTIESVMEQTHTDIGVVLVERCNLEERSTPILNVQHVPAPGKGLLAARNMGIKAADGIYLLVLNAADILLPTFVEEMVAAFDQHPGITIAHCRVENLEPVTGLKNAQAEALAELLVCKTIPHTALFKRSDWLSVGGFPETAETGLGEWDFWLSVARRGAGIQCVDKVLISTLASGNRCPQTRSDCLNPQRFDYLFSRHGVLYERYAEKCLRALLNHGFQQRSIPTGGDAAGHLAHELEAREIALEQLSSKLQLMQQSVVWRSAEFLRKLFYDRMLGNTPKLQQFVKGVRKQGVTNFLRLHKYSLLSLFSDDYRVMLKWQRMTPEIMAEMQADMDAFAHRPKISIVMPVYNVGEIWLRKALDSVIRQLYDNWELCICDDASSQPHIAEVLAAYQQQDSRIKLRRLAKNQGIAAASNAALSMATGEFVGLMDHDDELGVDAIFAVVKLINSDQQLDFIYSDEDKISEKGKRYDPFFKPDWSPDTLRSYNYICHFAVIRLQLARDVGGFRQGFEGSQDYDLFLRVTEATDKIAHIPKILYHWRSIQGSVGKDPSAKMYAYESAIRALSEHIQRIGLKGIVTNGPCLGSYHIRYRLEDKPMLSIVIPTRDKIDLLKQCIQSILDKTTYPHYEIVVVDNDSREARTFDYYKNIKNNLNIRILTYRNEFNFSAINNFAVKHIRSPYLLFLNNDTETITTNWIEIMLGYAQRPDVGAVGGLLYYSDDTVQHGGVVVGIGGIAGHLHKRFARESSGYYNRLQITQNMSAVTAACMMVRRSVFESVGGFDVMLTHAFNDVDLCLKIRQAGYLNVFTPQVELYHHESVSRGLEDTIEKQQRFLKERQRFSGRWRNILRDGDPYYNPNLTLAREDCSLWRPTDRVAV